MEVRARKQKDRHRYRAMEIVIRNNQRLIKINQRKVKKVIETSINQLASRTHNVLSAANHSISSLEVSVLFVNDRKMRDLNLAYRGIDKTTDVLSFPLINNKLEIPTSSCAPLLLGDIVINPYKAKMQAKQNGVSVQREISWLLIHGLLHLLGFDHEKNRYQAEKMRKMENEILGVVCR